MKIDANDPRWTAYALGELEDDSERAELESILKESEEMRLMVEDIRQTAELLNDGLNNESFAGLTGTQRDRIEAQATKRRGWLWSRPVWAWSGIAAVLILSLSVFLYQRQSGETGTLIAELRNEEAPVLESSPSESMTSETRDMTTEVEIAPASVTVKAKAENETPENGAADAADVSETVAMALDDRRTPVEPDKQPAVEPVKTDVITAEPEVPAQTAEVSTSAQNMLIETAASTGIAIEADAVAALPQQSTDAMELIEIMAGSVPGKMNLQQDGTTVNEVRYSSGIVSPSRVNPDMMRKSKLITAPVDAETGHRGRRPFPYPPANFNTEGYANILDNPFMEVTQNPLSTFSIDVDTASYSNVRRFLEQSELPPKDAVRIEELINYFDYDYEGPGSEGPFAAHFEMTESPWNPEHRLLRIGLKAKEIEAKERPQTNLVFLIDLSGSMSDPNKLPLVQDAMHLLIDQLTANDHVAIVTYAGSTRVALPSTRGDQKWSIHRAIDSLRSGGSTAGASGIQLAYETAESTFVKGGANRVILATDGDFNVGITSHGDLTRLIEEKADSGVFLSALGFGMGNYKDDTLEFLANKGRGNYAYIDTIDEARKVLVEQINATLVSVAKDVKIQVEFNPSRVGAYRLIGYEDKIMAKEDFNNDAKKASVIGAGHTVTAIYEIVPAGKPIPAPGVDPLKYQKPVETTREASSDETATVKIRYKEPEGEESRLLSFPVKDSERKFEKASGDFKFAASVAAFGMVLRDSLYKGSATLEDALSWAKEGQGEDRHGYRAEYIRLLHRAISIKK